jgi:hypothetical protein
VSDIDKKFHCSESEVGTEALLVRLLLLLLLSSSSSSLVTGFLSSLVLLPLSQW